MSIKTKYANAIYNGIKTVELRTIVPRQAVERVWLYETSPAKWITGYFTPGNISSERCSPNALAAQYTSKQLVGRDAQPWQMHNELGERSYKAIEVVNPTRLSYPVTPTSCGWPGKAWRSPESWRYATPEESKFLQERISNDN
jgi:predicted transcriptional regulator